MSGKEEALQPIHRKKLEEMRDIITQLFLMCACLNTIFPFFGRISIVAFRMRRPYKMFGFSPNSDKWQAVARSDLGDARIPDEARMPLLYAKKRRSNDIFTQLGDLGLGRHRGIYFPILVDISALVAGDSEKADKNSKCAPLSLIVFLFEVRQSALYAQEYRRL